MENKITLPSLVAHGSVYDCGTSMVLATYACPKQNVYQWFSVKIQYLQCINNGDTAVLH